jgi:tetratricopeptide (TPR) repeat protein
VRADAGDHHGALACFDTVLSMEDTREKKTAKLGAQVALPRTLDALSAAQASVPEEAVALANEGRALGKEGRTEDALILLERALAVARGYGRAWIDRGACLMLLRRYDEAIVSFDRAMTLDPRSRAVCLQNKGQCLGDLKRSDEALRCYEDAVSLAPESAILWFLRGEMERQVGDGERATRSLTHFISLASSSEPRFSRELERAQRWLSQAAHAEQPEQPGKADV